MPACGRRHGTGPEKWALHHRDNTHCKKDQEEKKGERRRGGDRQTPDTQLCSFGNHELGNHELGLFSFLKMGILNYPEGDFHQEMCLELAVIFDVVTVWGPDRTRCLSLSCHDKG